MNELVQVAIAGGGPAGLTAAISAASAGAKVVLFDENAIPGGQLRYRLGTIRYAGNVDFFPPRLAVELVARARDLGVDIRPFHRAWGLFAGNLLGIEHVGGSIIIKAERILLANGSIDRSLPFPGGSLPGVFTARAVQILLNTQFVLPGRRFAVIADAPDAAELIHEIEIAGGEVVAVMPVSDDGLEAIGADGVSHISSTGIGHDVDVVVVSAGRIADAGLALMAECAAGYSAAFGGFVPKTDASLQTSIPGLFVCGDCAGPCSAEVAMIEGEFAGTAVAASLGLVHLDELALARAHYVSCAADRIEELTNIEGSFVQVDRVPMGVNVE